MYPDAMNKLKRFAACLPIAALLFTLTPVPVTAIVTARPPCASPLAGTLAGITKAPGTYCLSAEAKTGTLTLAGPASGVWTFQIDGGFTGSSFNVVMAGGGLACNVHWFAITATMTDSNLQGIITADTGITLTRGSLIGQAVAPQVTNTGTKVTACPTTTPVTASPAAAVPANSGNDHPGFWLLLLLLLLLLLAAAVVAGYAIRRRRSKTPG